MPKRDHPTDSIARLIKKHFEEVEARLDKLTARIEKMEYRLSKMEDELRDLRLMSEVHFKRNEELFEEHEERLARVESR